LSPDGWLGPIFFVTIFVFYKTDESKMRTVEDDSFNTSAVVVVDVDRVQAHVKSSLENDSSAD
jgi:hypothetical protein